METEIAALDLGTNTFHLLIATVVGDTLVPRQQHMVGVQLGKSGFANGYPSDEAVALAAQTFARFMAIADEAGVPLRHRRAVGTSFFRSITDGERLMQAVAGPYLPHARIIGGAEEAQLIASGVLLACQPEPGEVALIVDIGGGSTEFTLVRNGEILYSRSFEVGGWRLLHLVNREDPLSKPAIELINQWLDDLLAPLLEVGQQYKPSVLIGSSGTFESLGEMLLTQQGGGDLPAASDLTLEEYRHLRDQLLAVPLVERLQLPGLRPLRAEMIQVALVLIDWIIAHSHATRLQVSRYALREGLALQLARELQ